MRVLYNNILIVPKKVGVKKTSYGLELGEKHREQERYEKAEVKYIGEAVTGVSVGDEVIYDKMAGYFIDIEGIEESVRVISDHDIKLIL